MKAIVQERFGPPDVLQLVDTDRPVAGADEVLVRVHAAALNPYDWHILRGDPLIARLMGEVGLTKPKARVAGVDAAGRVEAVGANVRGLRPGDEVLGFCRGAFAEYARAEADKVVPKPVSLTFEQAAAVPMAGATALRGIRDVGAVRAGHRVLVNGAAGGVGTYAVQIAAALGAEVTGVCSTRNAELVRSIGAAHVVDYTTQDFTDGRARYDVILDNVGNRPLRPLRRALTPAGTLVLNGGGSTRPRARARRWHPAGGRGQRSRPRAAPADPARAEAGAAAHPHRAHRGREAHTGPRPDLPAGRHGRGPAPRGAGARTRQGRHHRGVGPAGTPGNQRSGTWAGRSRRRPVHDDEHRPMAKPCLSPQVTGIDRVLEPDRRLALADVRPLVRTTDEIFGTHRSTGRRRLMSWQPAPADFRSDSNRGQSAAA